MKITTTIIILTVLCGTFFAAPVLKKDDLIKREIVSEDIQGYYEVSGKDGNDKEYQGIAIIRRVESTYLIQWLMGGTAFRGVGLRDGEKLVVGFVQIDRSIQGVYSYHIGKNCLTGRWISVPGDGVARTETMTFLKKIND